MATGPPAGKHVLVVEDEAVTQQALARLLARRGYRVTALGDGQEALAYLRTHAPPDLILLDLILPGLDGWGFRRQQRRDPALAAIPVAVLSAHSQVAERAATLGDVAYLGKPVNAAELFATVARLLAGAPGLPAGGPDLATR